MATQLLDSLAADWDPDRYHDTYAEELRKRIKARDKGKEIVEKDEQVPEGKVLDLMAALERSVEAAKGRKTAGTVDRQEADQQGPQERVAMAAAKKATAKKSPRGNRREEASESPEEDGIEEEGDEPARDLSRQARLHRHVRARRRPRRRRRTGIGSSCSATAPAACTTTCGSRSTACW